MSISAEEERAIAQAAEWHSRLSADDCDWDGFETWLAASPIHREAYDHVARLDREIGENAQAIAVLLPANDSVMPQPPIERSYPIRRWAMGVAAAVVAIVAVPFLRPTHGTSATFSTGAVGGRTVTLKDGSTIRLDRNTRLTVADASDRRVLLDQGTASFSVRHDAGRPFTIVGGAYEVRDIGTRFDVSRTPSHMTIAVAEGEVSIASEGNRPSDLKAGRRMDIDLANRTATINDVVPSHVSGWAAGRLQYQNTPLALVAADVGRYTAAPLAVEPGAAALRFSGVLTIGDGTRLVGQLEKLLPITARRENNTIILHRRAS
jgi:transmembrane sensor